jgi:archaeal flagellar protein FlaI
MSDLFEDMFNKADNKTADSSKKQELEDELKKELEDKVKKELPKEEAPKDEIPIVEELPEKEPDAILDPDKIVEKEENFEEVIESAKKKVISKYGNNITIYKLEGQPLLHYEVPTPKASGGENIIINTIKEAATRLIAVAPYRIRDETQRRNVYFQKIMDIIRSSPELKIPEGKMQFYANAVVREMVGYGKIDSLLKDEMLEEIMVIAPNRPVYIFHRLYEMMTTNIVFYTDKEIQDLVSRVARFTGRRIDYSQPLLDARLPDGSRVNATIPPASVSGSTLTIRKFRKDPYTVADLMNYNTLDPHVAAFLWLATDGYGVKPANILIAGGTGSGKTTTLNVLCSFIPSSERIVSIEDTAELNLPLQHWVRMEARPPGIEGTGEITLEMLTKNALRMRPDRVIVGEVRSKEAFSLFTAMNTGHDGCMGTLHANSSQETIARVTSPPMEVPEIMLSGLNLIVVQNRLHDRKKGTIRRITEIAEVSGVFEKKIQTQKIFEWDPRTDKLQDTTIPSRYLKLLSTLSNKSVKELISEINNREKYLKKMIENNIRNKDDVAEYIRKYYEEE